MRGCGSAVAADGGDGQAILRYMDASAIKVPPRRADSTGEVTHAGRRAEGNQGSTRTVSDWCRHRSPNCCITGTRCCCNAPAGVGAGLSDDDYRAAGATLVDGPERIFREAELVVKVKEPLPTNATASARTDPVHLSAPRARPRADQGTDRERRDASPTRPWTSSTGGLPLLKPMPKSPVGSRRRPARTASSPRAGRARRPARRRSRRASGRGHHSRRRRPPARMRRRSRSAWVPPSRWSISLGRRAAPAERAVRPRRCAPSSRPAMPSRSWRGAPIC